MAGILQIWIAPHVAFLPQAELGAYSDAALLEMGEVLRANELTGLYKAVLLNLDPLFIVVFGIWVMLSHVARNSLAWSLLGVALAVTFMALDFSEDMMLAARLGLTSNGVPEAGLYVAEVSKVHWITLAKYSVFAVCLISTVLVSRRPKA